MSFPLPQLYRAQKCLCIPLGEMMEEVVKVKICKCIDILEVCRYALSYVLFQGLVWSSGNSVIQRSAGPCKDGNVRHYDNSLRSLDIICGEDAEQEICVAGGHSFVSSGCGRMYHE